MSMEYLNQNKNVINIYLRQAAYYPPDNLTLFLNVREYWPGFTFNPGLKRMSDYKLIKGGYSKLTTQGDFKDDPQN